MIYNPYYKAMDNIRNLHAFAVSLDREAYSKETIDNAKKSVGGLKGVCRSMCLDIAEQPKERARLDDAIKDMLEEGVTPENITDWTNIPEAAVVALK